MDGSTGSSDTTLLIRTREERCQQAEEWTRLNSRENKTNLQEVSSISRVSSRRGRARSGGGLGGLGSGGSLGGFSAGSGLSLGSMEMTASVILMGHGGSLDEEKAGSEGSEGGEGKHWKERRCRWVGGESGEWGGEGGEEKPEEDEERKEKASERRVFKRSAKAPERLMGSASGEPRTKAKGRSKLRRGAKIVPSRSWRQ